MCVAYVRATVVLVHKVRSMRVLIHVLKILELTLFMQGCDDLQSAATVEASSSTQRNSARHEAPPPGMCILYAALGREE